jgi:CHAT domain-containing protein
MHNGSVMLSALPYAREEILLGARIFKGVSFLDQEATENNFKSLYPAPSILHLAMHILIEDRAPEKSRLIFTGTTDSIEDGNLFTYEIYNTIIDCQLAILSACNSGYGKVSKGEGIMNLSRAFMYAGCPNIVMSLWRARDEPTFTIVSGFLKYLKGDLSKIDALRQAKLDYLAGADPLQAHPSNWATLILVGDAGTLQYSEGRLKYLIGLLALPLLLWVVYIIFKGKLQSNLTEF